MHHSLGFSIIRPEGTRADMGPDTITILPDGGRSRYASGLSVRRLPEPPVQASLEQEGFRTGRFQNRDAFIQTGPSGKYQSYRIITRRGDAWYRISLYEPEGSAKPMPSPDWQQYLESFAAPDAPQRKSEASGGPFQQ